MKLFALIAAVTFAFIGLFACCKPQTPPEPPITIVDIDAQKDADDDASYDAARFPACTRACRNLKALGCPEAEKEDGGLSCYDVCAKAEASGKFTLRPDCVADAGTKEQLRDKCRVRCGAP